MARSFIFLALLSEVVCKNEYKVGGLAITGSANLFKQWNATFSTYLTAAVKRNPKYANISFRLVALDFYSTFDMVEQNAIDFIYTNPSIFSCLESEFQLTSLATLRNLALGKEVNQFGGVIFSKAGSAVRSLQDIRGRRVALSSLAALGAGQMQWRVLEDRGIRLMSDTAQVILVGNSQQAVVQLVYQGLADVGFVRTNQIESMSTATATTPAFPLPPPPGSSGPSVATNASLFNYIEADFPPYGGGKFPFLSSTQLYPEWCIGAMPTVDYQLQAAVQRAMQDVGAAAAGGGDGGGDPAVRAAALRAVTDGKYRTWQASVSYMPLRSMQELIGYIRQDGGRFRCVRADDAAVYQAISCPSGQFKRSQAEVFAGCARQGLACPTVTGLSITCICSPCYQANPVEVYPAAALRAATDTPPTSGSNASVGVATAAACRKMTVCFQAEQTRPITLLLVDNMRRALLNATAVLRSTKLEAVAAVPLNQSNASASAAAAADSPTHYSLSLQPFQIGELLLEVFVDGTQISNSPFLVLVVPRDCLRDFGEASNRVADVSGECVCQPTAVSIGESCVAMSTLLPAVVVPAVVCLAALVFLFVLYERRRSDSLWRVNFKELNFENPPVVLGRGSFGQVLQAEYRGTLVAVKRVLPTGAQITDRLFGKANRRQQAKDNATRATLDAMVAMPVPAHMPSRSTASTSSTGASPMAATVPSVPRMGPKIALYAAESAAVGDPAAPTAAPTSTLARSTALPAVSDNGTPQVAEPASAEIITIAPPPALTLPDPPPTMDDDPATKIAVASQIVFSHQVVQSSNAAATVLPPHQLPTPLMDPSLPPLAINDASDAPSATQPETKPTQSPPSSFIRMLLGLRSSGGGFSGSASVGQSSLAGFRGLAGGSGEQSRLTKVDEKAAGGGLMSFAASGGGSSSRGPSACCDMVCGKVMGTQYAEERRLAKLRADFVEEMRTLSKLRHPCITTVMGAVTGEERGTEPMLIMELMDHGSLYDLLHNETMVLEGDVLLPILRDIVQGMRFLHAATPPIVHGDLKAANVLVDATFRAKVADFGLSQKRRMGACGTPLWMAPELLRGGYPSESSDVYAFGIMLYEIFSRKNPYQDELEEVNLEHLLRQIRDNAERRPVVPTGTPAAAESMMLEAWSHQPEVRPRFEALEKRVRQLDVGGITRLALDQVKKRRREEAVLYDVFPRHVADALVAGRKVEPEAREVVTVYFSDIVGFTTISSTLSPEKISLMLDRLYNRFDGLSVEHGVFKVETIGDAWMGVTNLVEDQASDHALRIARFALGAMRAAAETAIDPDDPSRGHVHIRSGFHSGSVVASVVGTRAPRYCLFGDTVNTASRMESNSVEGRIHCSERAASILREQAPSIRLESRGLIDVKGKGQMSTFWLLGEGPAADPSVATQPPATPSAAPVGAARTTPAPATATVATPAGHGGGEVGGPESDPPPGPSLARPAL